MATYILLCHFTDQGVRGVKDSPKRARAFMAAAKKAGATVKEFYWTLGRYDMVSILDAPDVETVTALGLSVGSSAMCAPRRCAHSTRRGWKQS